MTGRELIQRVRFDVKDNNRAKYSDWDMLVALNTTLDEVYQELATFSNNVTVKTVPIVLVFGTGELPEDFLSVHEVYRGETVFTPVTKDEKPTHNEYFIEGNYIYADTDCLTLEYKCIAPELTMDDLDDDLELPNILNGYIKKHMVAVLAGEDRGFSKDLKATLAGRGFNRLTMRNVWSARL